MDVEQVQACGNLWANALLYYYRDARGALLNASRGGPAREALEDLLGDRRLLANLLDAYGGDIDADLLGDKMLDAMDLHGDGLFKGVI